MEGGAPRLVLIAGEAGIGKSRLLREWRTETRGRAASTAGRSYEDTPIAYLPFIDILNSLLDAQPDCLDLVGEEDRGIIRRLVGKEPADATRGQSSEGEQHQLGLAVARLAAALADDRPQLIALEDLHWADPSSLATLSSMVTTLAERSLRTPTRVMILATFRSGDLDANASKLLSRLRSEDMCTGMEMTGLTEAETADLIHGLGYMRPSQQLIATVFEATRGRPLFIREAMHHLAATDSLVERGGYLVTTKPASELKLPAEVTEVIESRLADVSGDARAVLDLAACLGDNISWPVLLQASGLDEADCLAALNACVGDSLLVPDGHVFRFAHPLVRHVSYRLIIGPRRERLHLAIAAALEAVYGDGFDEHISEIANHLLAAGSQADAETVVEHTKLAADVASGVFAWRQAARYYEAAIEAAGRSRQFSPRDIAELHARAAYSCYRDMDPGPSEDHYEQAVKGFRETGDNRSLVQAHADLARLHLTLASVPYGKLVDLDPIQQALPHLRSEDDDIRARALELVSTAYWHARMPEEAVKVAGEAFALARASGDDVTAARALNNRGMAHLSNLQLEEALADFEESVEIARPLGDPLILGLPLPRICPVLITMGRLNSAEVYIEEACRVLSQAGEWAGLSVALAYRISQCYFKGDFDGVERHALQGLQAARRSRYTWGAAVFLPTLASARSQRGETDEALDAIHALTLPGNIIDDPGATLNAIGLIFGTLVSAAAGDLGPAKARLPSMIAAAKAAGRRDIQSMSPYCALVEISAYLDDPASADTWYDSLLFARERGAVLCSSWGFLVSRVLGLISSLNERWEQADAHFADALEVSGRIGARGELGRTLLDYAGMLARRGLRDDRKGAAQMIEQATAIFAGLGMLPLVARAEALSASLGAQAPVAVESEASSYPGNLSRREVEVLRLLSRGYTNKRIAEELVLSTKTVARHISNIFGKIEVDNRSGATAYAFEHGLAGRIDQEGRRI